MKEPIITDKLGQIYFLRINETDPPRIKIGFTTVEKPTNRYRTCYGILIEEIKRIKGSYKLEQILHDHFYQSNIEHLNSKEWFYETPELLDTVYWLTDESYKNIIWSESGKKKRFYNKVKDLYLNKKLSIDLIAKEMKRNPLTIRQYISTQFSNKKKRKIITPEEWENIKSVLEEKSVKETADYFNISTFSIYRRLKEEKI